MRMRFKPYARPELAAFPRFVDDPHAQRDDWPSFFEDPALPLRLELGCGKGGFLAAAALGDPACNYLGVDIKSEVLVVAKRTAERLSAQLGKPLGNYAITAYNIEKIADLFPEQPGIDRIYINFCNPWTKGGYAKHRLTHPRQLIQYRGLLRPEGEIWFKTDNEQLFADSLRYFPFTGFEVVWSTRDLHKEEPAWNIRTEHERMFSDQGIPIKACKAQMRPALLDKDAILRTKTL